MGLLKIPEYLKEKCGHLLHKEHISLFAHQRVFLDIAGFLYKFACTLGVKDNRWVNAFVSMMLMFRRNAVIIIPVFDGQAPQAKLAEQQERREQRQKKRERTERLRAAIAAFEVGDRTEDTMTVLSQECQSTTQRGRKAASQREANGDDEGGEGNNESATPRITILQHISAQQLAGLKFMVDMWERQTSSLSPDDLKFLKDILSASGITWLQAPTEAEAYCCYLVRNGYGAAVISADSDCLAHRADVIINDIDVNTGAITFYNLADILQHLQLHERQLIDLGILVGCDYNPGSRVNRIGPVKAIKLLQQYGDIDHIPDLNDVGVLKHHMIRELFDPKFDNVVVPHTEPNEDHAQMLCADRPDVELAPVMHLIKLNQKKREVEVVNEVGDAVED